MQYRRCYTVHHSISVHYTVLYRNFLPNIPEEDSWKRNDDVMRSGLKKDPLTELLQLAMAQSMPWKSLFHDVLMHTTVDSTSIDLEK